MNKNPLLALVALGLSIVFSASGQPAARQMLRGHVPVVVSRLQPVRRLEATNRLQLAIGLPLRNQDALDKLLQDIYDPASPHFRLYLTVEEFTRQFGPAARDYEAVEGFLKTNGFTLKTRQSNRMVLDMEGSAADIERTFHVKMQVYRHPAEAREFFSPDSEPQLDLTTPVLHIGGLDNFVLPRALSHPRPLGNAIPQGTGSGPSSTYVGGNFRAAYVPGVALTGAGQSVALVEFQGYYASDITKYESNYSVPAVPLSYVLLDGITSITSDAGGAEPALDIEMAISMAPGLSGVIFYYGSNPDDIYSRIATDNLAKQISASYTFGIDATTLQLYQELASQGQSCFTASGDSDAYNADSNPVPTPTDAPYITVVGGTSLTTSGGATGVWVSESAWNWGGGTGTSGGISTTYPIPLWQQGINMDTNLGSTAMRNLPDVALTADSVWVLYGDGKSGSYGGTSCATPLWAGFMALVNQQAVAKGLSSVGFINPTIYALGKGTNYTAAFHDIVSGNNTSSSSPNEFYAVAGYDLCTGWGTPAGSNLINALASSRFDPLVVTPTNGFTAAGPAGGPFIPASFVFSPANFGGASMNWSLINTSAWFTVSPASGTLAVGASANVTVTVSSAANSLSAGYYSATLLFSNASTHVVQTCPLELVVGSGLTWNSAGSDTNAAQDGNGIWADQSADGGTNWWNGGNVQWNNTVPDIATFGANNGAAGTVTLGSAITAGGINFGLPGSGNYTIAGGGYTLTLNGYIAASNSAAISAPVNLGEPGTFNAAGGQTLTVSGLISGANGNYLAINGPGTVSLTGQNNSSQSAGMAGAVTVNSGTLSLNSGNSTYGTLGNVAGITVNSGAALSLQGNNAISGSAGTGRNVTVNNGVVTNNGGAHALGILTLNGATLAGAGTFNLTGDVFGNSNSVISAQTVSTVAGMSFNAGSGADLTFSGTLTGSGGLTFAGPGTMIFSGTNSSTAGTTIRAGTLQVGNGGAGGSLGTGAVISGGLLQFNRSDNFTWATPVTDPGDSGTFIKLNTDTMTLTATNDFLAPISGAAQVNGGTLQINSPGLLASGGDFWVAQNATTAACIINGGTLIASNWIVIGRDNSAAVGTLTLNSGSIQKYTANGDIIMGSLGGTGTMTVNGGTVANSSAIWLGEDSTGRGTLNLNGGLVQATQVTRAQTTAGASAIVNFNGGTLQATTNQPIFLSIDQANVQAGNAIIDDGGNAIVIGQPLLAGGGAGGLVKNGAGTLTLTASNTYTGPTTVNFGTLKVSPDPVLHLSFDNVSGTNVINNGTGGTAMNGTLTGTASIVSGGRYGNALSIPAGAATNAYVLVNNPVVAMTGAASWTIGMWAKTTTAGGVYAYQGSGSWASGNMTFYLNEGSDNGYGTKAGGVSYAQGWEEGSTKINDGNWHFVVMTCNGSTKAMYVDGNVDAIASSWAPATGVGSQLWIGGSADTGDEDVGLNGLIDEVYVFSRALSRTEVQSLMTSNQLGYRQVLPPATAVTLATDTTLDLSSMSQTIGSLSGANSSSVLLGSGTNFSALTFGNASNTTFAGTISGNGSVTKVGSGSTLLSGVNVYTGPTIIAAGTVGFGEVNNSNYVAALGPVLWFTFSQVSGVSAGGVVTNLGSGGSAYNGTIEGTATIVSGGRYGNGLSIPSGASSAAYVLINSPVVSMTGAASWTLAMWVKTMTSGGVYAYQGSGGWASGNMDFYLNDGSGAGTHAGGVSYAQGWEEGSTAINNGSWHFVAMTCNGTNKTMYVDGNVDAIASSWASATGVGTQLRIGGNGTGEGDGQVGLNGTIDEVYMFNRALSQSEIVNIMNNQSVDPITNVFGQLPATSPVSVASGATLDLSGISQTIASLSDVGGAGGLVTNNSNTNATLTITGSATTTFSGQINDAGNGSAISLIKSGNSTQVLAGANAYSGTTTISNGSLLVNGSLGTNAVIVSGGLLGGNGAIGGPVTIQSGGTLSPGSNSIGALTINNTLTLAGTTYIEINQSVPTNDIVCGLSAVTFGGTLTVTNLGGTLAAGDSFTIFPAASCSGTFAALNLPALNTGLGWNSNSLANGTLSVIAAVPPQFGSVSQTSDGTLQFSATGAAGVNYELDTATNLAPPITWIYVTNAVAGTNGMLQFPNLSDTNFPQQFYRIISIQ